ncbi:putative disease resistance RPP13-like protein 1 isoform X2 [Prosopis cineraria]|nr:putative disease resistance RPP13-like protein 1 isoform X2 [Prosopis cineraria]
MAAELVGGAFLSATHIAFEKLASSIHYFQSKNLKDGLLEKLHLTLISVNQVLDDVEVKQHTNSNVKKWLQELKHAIYMANDLLDEIATEATKLKIEAENQLAPNKVRSYLTASDNPFDKHMEARIQEVLDNLEFLAKQKVLWD